MRFLACIPAYSYWGKIITFFSEKENCGPDTLGHRSPVAAERWGRAAWKRWNILSAHAPLMRRARRFLGELTKPAPVMKDYGTLRLILTQIRRQIGKIKKYKLRLPTNWHSSPT